MEENQPVQFSLRSLFLATDCFAVAFAIVGYVIRASERDAYAPIIASVIGGVGVGILFGSPRGGEWFGLFFSPIAMGLMRLYLGWQN